MDEDVRVVRDEERQRFVALLGEDVAGVAEYERSDGAIVFTHTVVRDEFEGRGIGSRLASTALDSARDDGLAVVARCDFIRGYIERHPSYADLVRAPDGS